ncbi:MAG: hypothetical protein AAFX08_03195 [Pseudomonadota bacterium]
MIRILLPLAVLAALLFAPIFSETVVSGEFGENTQTYTGHKYVGNTVDCWVGRNFSISGECEPQGGRKGFAIFAAVFVSATAAALGVIGLIPFVGRITSLVTSLAGVVVVAAIAFFVFSQMSGDAGLEGVQWGSYVAGGGGLLTLISGLAGMRGE